jgi:2-oxoglutarate ferredoxin oxidoreductase subunit alpha
MRGYSQDLGISRHPIAQPFGKKGEQVIESNRNLLEAGHRWARANLDFRFFVPSVDLFSLKQAYAAACCSY